VSVFRKSLKFSSKAKKILCGVIPCPINGLIYLRENKIGYKSFHFLEPALDGSLPINLESDK